MANALHVSIEGEPTIIEDSEPLESAKLFKHISDAVWERRPSNHPLNFIRIPVLTEPGNAMAEATATMEHIDRRLIIGTAATGLHLTGPWGQKVVIKPSVLEQPQASAVETFVWDDLNTGRLLELNGERKFAKFTDQHRDYSRELSLGFWFDPDNGSTLSLSYVMQRSQVGQDKPTEISLRHWYSDFAESGYEGNSRFSRRLTVEQETKVLELFAKLGGIALPLPIDN
ncbi:MAG TPA: hypothetical protein VLG37_00235 [Candidatus Saccharimonadales bacterium]|nr:hypothetical protein [Candidatus Saccharimonadales bacterium]